MSAQSLTIAYRGNFRPSFSTETHASKSLELLGHRVIRLQEDEVGWDVVRHEALGAHMFLWQRTWNIDPDGGHATLAVLRDAGVPSVSYHLDRYIGLDREAQIADGDPFWRTDLAITADGGNDEAFAAYGVNHRWLPPGVFGPECRATRAVQRPRHSIVFVGSHPYPHAEWQPYRTELINTLRRRYGARFGVYPRNRRQPLRGQALTNLYSSAKVVVGDSCLLGNPTRYWSDRIPETLGRGGLLIHPEVEGLDDWYRHRRELLTYPLGDFEEICRLVDWVLANRSEAETIRLQGQSMVLSRDTYEHRMAEVLRIVGDELGFPDPLTRPVQPVVEHMAVRSPQLQAAARFQLAEGRSDALAVREIWESDDYRLLGRDLRDRTVVDIGANIGAFSVLTAQLGAQVHAYEPHPDNLAALRRNLTVNAAANGVTIHDQAVMGEAGKVRLTGVGGGVHVAADGEDGPVVEAVAIDDVLRDAGEIALLKMDVEGAEYDIFAGLRDRELLNGVETMAVEFHGPGMPHLAHLDGSGWAPMVEMLANYGRIEIFGRPAVGGLLWWSRF